MSSDKDNRGVDRRLLPTCAQVEGWKLGPVLLLWVVCSAFSLAIYWQALRGPFISDDVLYIVSNPWTTELSLENVVGMFDPVGESRFQTANYAPLHLLATATERWLFWDDPLGYHVVNALVHALNAVLLMLLFIRSGLSVPAGFLGGVLFLVHPANVEAVAWSSQLKTDGALALSLGALLSFRRFPATATLLFTAGLLTKASASFTLPMVVVGMLLCGADQDKRRLWPWVGAWVLALALYSVPQFSAFHPRGDVEVPEYADTLVHLRTIASIGARYLAMAATSWGLSHAPEHPPVTDALDPWWLIALPATALLTWRIVVTLRRKSVESAYWIGAAAAFVPVSQIIPFSHPIGDRYLYFILPGLIGGTLFAMRDAAENMQITLSRLGAASSVFLRASAAVAVVLAIFFAIRASERARLWSDEMLLSLDSARHFPEGRAAAYLDSQRAAQSGDVDTAVSRLREAQRLKRDLFHSLLLDPLLEPVRSDPVFRELVREVAGRYIDQIRSRDPITQTELSAISIAYFERGQYDEAERALETAVARGGILERELRSELESLRLLRAEDAGDRVAPPQNR